MSSRHREIDLTASSPPPSRRAKSNSSSSRSKPTPIKGVAPPSDLRGVERKETARSTSGSSHHSSRTSSSHHSRRKDVVATSIPIELSPALKTSINTLSAKRLRRLLTTFCETNPDVKRETEAMVLRREEGVTMNRFAICAQCEEEYDTLKNKGRDCCMHSGLKVLGNNPPSHWANTLTLPAFQIWSCCNLPLSSPGCSSVRHTPLSPSSTNPQTKTNSDQKLQKQMLERVINNSVPLLRQAEIMLADMTPQLDHAGMMVNGPIPAIQHAGMVIRGIVPGLAQAGGMIRDAYRPLELDLLERLQDDYERERVEAERLEKAMDVKRAEAAAMAERCRVKMVAGEEAARQKVDAKRQRERAEKFEAERVAAAEERRNAKAAAERAERSKDERAKQKRRMEVDEAEAARAAEARKRRKLHVVFEEPPSKNDEKDEEEETNDDDEEEDEFEKCEESDHELEHSGRKKVTDDCEHWCDWDEECHGYIDTLVDDPDHQDGFKWTCCGEYGDIAFCTRRKRI